MQNYKKIIIIVVVVVYPVLARAVCGVNQAAITVEYGHLDYCNNPDLPTSATVYEWTTQAGNECGTSEGFSGGWSGVSLNCSDINQGNGTVQRRISVIIDQSAYPTCGQNTQPEYYVCVVVDVCPDGYVLDENEKCILDDCDDDLDGDGICGDTGPCMGTVTGLQSYCDAFQPSCSADQCVVVTDCPVDYIQNDHGRCVPVGQDNPCYPLPLPECEEGEEIDWITCECISTDCLYKPTVVTQSFAVMPGANCAHYIQYDYLVFCCETESEFQAHQQAAISPCEIAVNKTLMLGERQEGDTLTTLDQGVEVTAIIPICNNVDIPDYIANQTTSMDLMSPSEPAEIVELPPELSDVTIPGTTDFQNDGTWSGDNNDEIENLLGTLISQNNSQISQDHDLIGSLLDAQNQQNQILTGNSGITGNLPAINEVRPGIKIGDYQPPQINEVPEDFEDGVMGDAQSYTSFVNENNYNITVTNAVQNLVEFSLDDPICSINTTASVFGSPVDLQFSICEYEEILEMMGMILISLANLNAFFIITRR